MKVLDIVILSTAIVFLIIGIDQIMKVGFADAYWAIMLALVLFFVFNLRRRKTE
jgi:hypothetical protein